ncbi:hypothetical protein [Singapore grouper iridovirus]|nr:hypothetical protein [Singapore grouper iridovirus]
MANFKMYISVYETNVVCKLYGELGVSFNKICRAALSVCDVKMRPYTSMKVVTMDGLVGDYMSQLAHENGRYVCKHSNGQSVPVVLCSFPPEQCPVIKFTVTEMDVFTDDEDDSAIKDYSQSTYVPMAQFGTQQIKQCPDTLAPHGANGFQFTRREQNPSDLATGQSVSYAPVYQIKSPSKQKSSNDYAVLQSVKSPVKQTGSFFTDTATKQNNCSIFGSGTFRFNTPSSSAFGTPQTTKTEDANSTAKPQDSGIFGNSVFKFNTSSLFGTASTKPKSEEKPTINTDVSAQEPIPFIRLLSPPAHKLTIKSPEQYRAPKRALH